MKQHYRATLQLGFPIAVGQLGTIVLAFADTIMVGHYGTAELAAASFVNGVFNLATMIILGYNYGLTPIIAAHEGRGEQAAAGWALRCGWRANLRFGSVLLLLFALLYFVLDRLGQPAELLPLMRPYYLVMWSSLWFVLLFGVLRQFTDALTHTRLSMWLLLGGNLLNIALNYLLIFGHLGFPEWGLWGAGIATLTSRVCMALVLLFLIVGHPRYAPYRQLPSSPSTLTAACVHRQSWPVAAQMGMEASAFSCSSLMAGWLGALPLAAYQVLIALGHLGFLLYYSMGAAVSIRIAHFLGMSDAPSALLAGRAGRNILLLCALLVSLVFGLGGRQLLGVFSSDAAVVSAATAILLPLVVYQLFDAMQVCYANALRATSRVRPMTWIAFVAYLLVGLPCSYLLAFPLHLGLQGLFLSFSISLGVAAWLFRRYYHRALSHF